MSKSEKDIIAQKTFTVLNLSKKGFVRPCPSCGREMRYTKQNNFTKAKRIETLCPSCQQSFKYHNSVKYGMEEFKQMMDRDRYELIYDCVCGEHVQRIAFRGWNIKCPKCYAVIHQEETEPIGY